MSVVDDRFPSVSIPAVQLHAAAALIQRPVGERHVTNPPGRSGRSESGGVPGRHLMYGSVLLALVTWSLVR